MLVIETFYDPDSFYGGIIGCWRAFRRDEPHLRAVSTEKKSAIHSLLRKLQRSNEPHTLDDYKIVET